MKNKYLFIEEKWVDSIREKLSNVNDLRLIKSVLKLNNQTANSSSHMYRDIRIKYCAINIILNERGLLAPVFRPFRKLKHRRILSDDDILLGLDRQIIDLHYLYCKYGEYVKPNDKQFVKMFTGDHFDYDLASVFAATKWKTDTKAKQSLNLTTNIQEQLWVIREKRIVDRHITVNRSIDKMRYQLNELADSPSSRLKRIDLPDRIEEFASLKYGRGSATAAVEYYSLRGNIHQSNNFDVSGLRKKMQLRKNWFETRLGYRRWT